MPVLNQLVTPDPNKKLNRAIAHEITAELQRPYAGQGTEAVANAPLQRQTVVQKKPGEDDELPVQRMVGVRDLSRPLRAFQPVQKKENKTGLPDGLKTGVESVSGFDLSDVRVHYNSPQPAQLQALAYAQGNDVHLGPGQEKHLPHEAWHVVQQRQGRVTPTAQLKGGIGVNDDAGLEAEADHMGAKIASASDAQAAFRPDTAVHSNIVQQKVIQRIEVPTNFGKFESTKFAEAEGRGVEITLLFHPDKTKIDAKKIALVQSVKTTMPSGAAYAVDANARKKMVRPDSPGAGYIIDRLSDRNNPVYGADSLAADQTIKDTPHDNNNSANAPQTGVNTTYQTGQCYKVNQADADKTVTAASLYDKPRGIGTKGEGKLFETTALALEGTDKDKYFGSVKWGYKMDGTDAAPTVTKHNIESASMGNPTHNLIEPAKQWNAAKTRGTLKVIADPATVKKADGSTEPLTKDKKLKQVAPVAWGADVAVEAEILNDNGSGSGQVITIKQADVEDAGDGAATKPLPIPAD